ncbi:ATP-dependent dethiobiotin synthetase BioD [Streptomyces oryzae]|uniref:ATP-dependent dethiobiotin synthetase BioD n=1 Tax=Streptomyces oryzae TaxID=1434886 RepID=A0ABS3XBA0_9ACTN|nr:dethiobiotin synthase [Streptomyces oryzae]MBO8192638.1 ATP-dependent dethiobiotin synthetase BioD [Streptomyces oryzae]
MAGPRGVLCVSGGGTEIGKTVTTAAVAACALRAGRSVAVLKPAQTGVAAGEPGDVAEVLRLTGGEAAAPGAVTGVELARYPEPLAPETAARRAGLPYVSAREVAEAAEKLAASHDLVLVEGAGGLLVRFDDQGSTLADAARLLAAPVLVVVQAGLGTLNTATLTAEALRARRVECAGTVIGSTPAAPGLAERCNVADLPRCSGLPLLGAVPEGAGALSPARFAAAAPGWLAPELGGTAAAPTALG